MPDPCDSSDDFRKAVGDVQPLRPVPRATVRKPAPPPLPVQSLLDEHAALVESMEGPFSAEEALETGEELAYLREGLSRQVLRKLRRGHWVIQAALDLHGMNRNQAALAVAAFLREAGRRHLRCIRIVHGKGLGSKHREPVLKGKLRHWLAMRDEVLAYCQAPAHEGGGGAVLVLLKAQR
jgi:DNA-nicking Smr family endonuclease